MLSARRRIEILEFLGKNKTVEVKELSAKFSISEVTIRRDLKALEKEGLLSRTHGGAVAKGGLELEPPYVLKEISFIEKKQKIGKKAAEYILDNEAIILNAGTTTMQIAKNIKDRKNLTIVTNAVNIATELINYPNIQVILTGGILREKSLAMVGPLAEQALKEIHVEKAFMGVNGVSVELGISMFSLIEAQVNKAIIRASKEIIVVVDSSKFNTVALSLIAPITAVHKIITDNKVSPKVVKALEQGGIEVITV